MRRSPPGCWTADRRAAQRGLAQSYHLTQLFLAFQPVPELVYLVGDRAFTAGREADDPHAIAVAAWYLNGLLRDSGQQHEARVQLATETARLLQPDVTIEDRALWGLLQLAAALSYAKIGQDGDACATRRSFHSIETARAYQLKREPVATVHLLRKAYDESPDTIRFNLFARSAVHDLRQSGGNTIRAEVDDLARKLDLAG